MQNLIYNLEITGLSPVFIGSGDLYSQLDYISENDKIHLIDFEKLLTIIPPESIDDLTNAISENFRNNRWEGNVQRFLESYHLRWRDFIQKSYDLVGEVGQNELQQFIKTGERIYLPGSSVKGALRTCILFNILANNSRLREQENNNILRFFNDRNIQKRFSGDAKKDLLRALSISDSFLSVSENTIKIMESNVYNLENREQTIPIFNEVLDRNFESKGTLTINLNLLNSRALNSSLFNLDINSLINAANEFSTAIVDYELVTLQSRNDPNLSNIVSFYRDLKEKLENLSNGECILRIGQGSSVLAITLFLNYKDNIEIVQKYKGIEIVEFNRPDTRNRGFAIANKNGINYFIDRNSQHRPRLNETWICSVQSRGRTNYVKLLERVERRQGVQQRDLLYPITRKLTLDSSKKLKYPFGWVVLKLTKK